MVNIGGPVKYNQTYVACEKKRFSQVISGVTPRPDPVIVIFT